MMVENTGAVVGGQVRDQPDTWAHQGDFGDSIGDALERAKEPKMDIFEQLGMQREDGPLIDPRG